MQDYEALCRKYVDGQAAQYDAKATYGTSDGFCSAFGGALFAMRLLQFF